MNDKIEPKEELIPRDFAKLTIAERRAIIASLEKRHAALSRHDEQDLSLLVPIYPTEN